MAETFSIAAVEEMSGISAFTIRYYDKCGFFPHLERKQNGFREFHETDIEQLYLVDALRKSGLSIEGIRYFVRLQKNGTSNGETQTIVKDRMHMLELQKMEIDKSIAHLQAFSDSLPGEAGTNKAIHANFEETSPQNGNFHES